MSDLKVYCTKDAYLKYMLTGRVIACSPETRNSLLLENRGKHKDLNVRLSINKSRHKIIKIDEEWLGSIPEGKWYDIFKQ